MKTYSIALIAPDGSIVASESLGHSSSSGGPSYMFACNKVREFLESEEGRSYVHSDVVLRDVAKMLSDLKDWHSIRLAWGDTDPLGKDAEQPGDNQTAFTLYKFSGFGRGQAAAIFTAELPAGWWELDEDERYDLLD